MKIRNLTFFALFTLCLIGCSSGSSAVSSSSSSSTKYDASVEIFLNEYEITEADSSTITVRINNYGPDDIDETVNIEITFTEDDASPEPFDSDDVAMTIPSGTYVDIVYDAVYWTPAEYVIYVDVTFDDDTTSDNNADSVSLSVDSDALLAPEGEG